MEISRLLLKWYEKEGRDLPWRHSSDPYKIWVSEVILQQTRIQQGTDYYHRFINRFPDVYTLASAGISEVLKLWQGLGYYSRARNMHEAAKTIVSKHSGIFPDDYNQILKLKGIGEYTAGAIVSIAYNQPVPAIDGNVKRVVSRIFSIYDDLNKPEGHRKIKNILTSQVSKKEPGAFNQALMDLGSLICKPLNPLCAECPLVKGCGAFLNNRVEELPVKYKKQRQRIRYFYYCIIKAGSKILIHQRTKQDIWQMLYEFPLIETSEEMDAKTLEKNIKSLYFRKSDGFVIEKVSPEIKHILSHQKLITRFIHLSTGEMDSEILKNYIAIAPEKIQDYPLPRLIDRYLESDNKL